MPIKQNFLLEETGWKQSLVAATVTCRVVMGWDCERNVAMSGSCYLPYVAMRWWWWLYLCTLYCTCTYTVHVLTICDQSITLYIGLPSRRWNEPRYEGIAIYVPMNGSCILPVCLHVAMRWWWLYLCTLYTHTVQAHTMWSEHSLIHRLSFS